MHIEDLLEKIKNTPNAITFDEVMALINTHYNYSPSRFSNGSGDDMEINEAGCNEGSCKIFSFAKINGLDEQQTLNCFGDYYRKDVLANPEADDHANIRSFIRHGWAGINFEHDALTAK